MDEDNYSLLQEARFSNKTGSSLTETVIVTQLPVFLNYVTVLYLVLKKSHKKNDNVKVAFLIEMCITILPLVLFLTVGSHLIYLLITTSFVFIIILLIVFVKHDIQSSWRYIGKILVTDDRPACVTNFRAIVNVYSVFSILAADFVCFPARYLKTESSGYGLMDTGVGLFIMMYAFSNLHRKNNLSLMHECRRAFPLAVLGIGRYISTTAVNYHHQVTEYGTQWNFFISLFVLMFFNGIIFRFIKTSYSVTLLLIFFSTTHEFVLQIGVQRWVISNVHREGFIFGNREGICSLLGYEIIYLLGLLVGNYLPKKGEPLRKYVNILLQYTLIFCFSIILTKLAESTFTVSRRTANSGYILWVLSITLLSLMVSLIFEIIIRLVMYNKSIPHVYLVPLIMKSVNYNGLAFFLLGNLLTGLVNLSMKTLLLSNFVGVVIILLYMFCSCSIIVYMYRKNIRLK